VAVAAIDAQFLVVVFMAERDGLIGRFADFRPPRRARNRRAADRQADYRQQAAYHSYAR
jgi:hypothetical protein